MFHFLSSCGVLRDHLEARLRAKCFQSWRETEFKHIFLAVNLLSEDLILRNTEIFCVFAHENSNMP